MKYLGRENRNCQCSCMPTRAQKSANRSKLTLYLQILFKLKNSFSKPEQGLMCFRSEFHPTIELFSSMFSVDYGGYSDGYSGLNRAWKTGGWLAKVSRACVMESISSEHNNSRWN